MQRPLIFGEVLFDVFPDRNEVLGGAAFNVAWHLQGFGAHPLFVSAVGQDARGDTIRALMKQWGMDDAGLQTDPVHASGVVQVRITNGQPSYDIVADQAYDFIRFQRDAFEDAHIGLMYHGSLALRQSGSRNSLFQIQETLQSQRFMDINLRPPWWNAGDLNALMTGSAWLKLNDEELTSLVESLKLPGTSLQEQAQALRSHFSSRMVILTCGDRGAKLIDEHRVIEKSVPPVDKVADTVGAGDAFSAVCLLGLLKQWPHEQFLQRALDFAAEICKQRGATALNHGL